MIHSRDAICYDNFTTYSLYGMYYCLRRQCRMQLPYDSGVARATLLCYDSTDDLFADVVGCASRPRLVQALSLSLIGSINCYGRSELCSGIRAKYGDVLGVCE